jgi:hypothetical protein
MLLKLLPQNADGRRIKNVKNAITKLTLRIFKISFASILLKVTSKYTFITITNVKLLEIESNISRMKVNATFKAASTSYFAVLILSCVFIFERMLSKEMMLLFIKVSLSG